MSAQPLGGLLGHLQAVLAGVIEIGHNRLELARVEIEEERLRLAGQLLWACIAGFALAVGSVLLALLVVLLCWDGPREWALGLAASLFVAVGAAAVWRWRHLSQHKPPLLQSTLAELRRDRAALMDSLR